MMLVCRHAQRLPQWSDDMTGAGVAACQVRRAQERCTVLLQPLVEGPKPCYAPRTASSVDNAVEAGRQAIPLPLDASIGPAPRAA